MSLNEREYYEVAHDTANVLIQGSLSAGMIFTNMSQLHPSDLTKQDTQIGDSPGSQSTTDSLQVQ